jgi:hypothetical protein
MDAARKVLGTTCGALASAGKRCGQKANLSTEGNDKPCHGDAGMVRICSDFDALEAFILTIPSAYA